MHYEFLSSTSWNSLPLQTAYAILRDCGPSGGKNSNDSGPRQLHTRSRSISHSHNSTGCVQIRFSRFPWLRNRTGSCKLSVENNDIERGLDLSDKTRTQQITPVTICTIFLDIEGTPYFAHSERSIRVSHMKATYLLIGLTCPSQSLSLCLSSGFRGTIRVVL